MTDGETPTTAVRRLDRILGDPVQGLGDEREAAVAARTWRSASVLGVALAGGVVAGVASRGVSAGSTWSVEIPAWYLLVPVLVVEAAAALFRRSYGVRLRHYGVLSSISRHTGRGHSRDWRDWAAWFVMLVVMVLLSTAMIQHA
ncbi:MAG: hypothetical protein ACRCY8_14555 [Dermatophilaceae bacterium]